MAVGKKLSSKASSIQLHLNTGLVLSEENNTEFTTKYVQPIFLDKTDNSILTDYLPNI